MYSACVGISGDDSSSHMAFAKKYKLPFTLLSDKVNKMDSYMTLLLTLSPTRTGTASPTKASTDLKSVAVEAVLLLQEEINDEDDTPVSIRLLVPSKVIGCIIGRSGSIINEIRKRNAYDY
ncbi:RNA-binding KH domain-containing protein [Trifolium repens]|nr:RNA-binding KH domain-containing protein [Trifolium repens]